MSLRFIYQFQAKIYELLSKTPEIKNSVSGVYLSVQHDAKYPFILINILKINDISRHEVDMYEVDFEVCIFAREKARELLLQMAGNTVEILQPNSLSGGEYSVLSMKETGVEFVRGHDLLTTKIIINYKALLQEIIRRI